jgi:hypothetical protein
MGGSDPYRGSVGLKRPPNAVLTVPDATQAVPADCGGREAGNRLDACYLGFNG